MATRQLRNVTVLRGTVTPRPAVIEGVDYIVVPVVALTEGVVFAMNASAPELVRKDRYAESVGSWNGRPIYQGHPLDPFGSPVSGNSPQVLQSRIGWVYDAGIQQDKLTMNAYIDVKRCESIAPRLLERLRAGDPIEISVGAFVSYEDVSGTHDGTSYSGAWDSIYPDHLALLPEGVEGACSRTMGCGVRAASGSRVDRLIGNHRVAAAPRSASVADPEDWTNAMQQARRPFDRDEALRKAMQPVQDVGPAPAPSRDDEPIFPSVGNGPSADDWTAAFQNRKLHR